MGGEEHPRGVRTDYAKREAAKHVESFGVGFWIRVRFPAPPPSQNFGLRIADCGFEGASISPRSPQSPQCPHSPHVDSALRRDPLTSLGVSCAPHAISILWSMDQCRT